jgi:hypothetical protein
LKNAFAGGLVVPAFPSLNCFIRISAADIFFSGAAALAFPARRQRIPEYQRFQPDYPSDALFPTHSHFPFECSVHPELLPPVVQIMSAGTTWLVM